VKCCAERTDGVRGIIAFLVEWRFLVISVGDRFLILGFTFVKPCRLPRFLAEALVVVISKAYNSVVVGHLIVFAFLAYLV
jgi:hypothetical protein